MPRVRSSIFCLLVVVLAAPAPAREEKPDPAEAALGRGLTWLSEKQNEDGSFNADTGFKLGDGYVVTRRNGPHVGVTALAGLALLEGGKRHRKAAKAAVRYVRSCQGTDGLIQHKLTRMYSHAFGTLLLARWYQETEDEEARWPLARAARITWRCSAPKGGWGYVPWSQYPDLTVSACQVLALRAAMDAGVEVPPEAFRRAEGFVLSCLEETDPRGAFTYRPVDRPSRASFCTTAGGLLCLEALGRGDYELFEESVTFLLRTCRTTRRQHYYWYFGNLLAVKALRAAGGDDWKGYSAGVRADLVKSQRPDGSWPIDSIGETYATASACLILQGSRP